MCPRKASINMPKIKCNSNRSSILKLYRANKIAKIMTKKVNTFTYVNNRALFFNLRENMHVKSRITYKVIVK